jgi:hypothetical protein
MLGGVAAMTILVGKFWLDSDPALYGGVALLVGASLWNAWPKAAPALCPACISRTVQAINERELDGVQSK